MPGSRVHGLLVKAWAIEVFISVKDPIYRSLGILAGGHFLDDTVGEAANRGWATDTVDLMCEQVSWLCIALLWRIARRLCLTLEKHYTFMIDGLFALFILPDSVTQSPYIW